MEPQRNVPRARRLVIVLVVAQGMSSKVTKPSSTHDLAFLVLVLVLVFFVFVFFPPSFLRTTLDYCTLPGTLEHSVGGLRRTVPHRHRRAPLARRGIKEKGSREGIKERKTVRTAMASRYIAGRRRRGRDVRVSVFGNARERRPRG